LFAYVYTFLAAIIVTFAVTPLVKKLAIKIGAVDRPNARKVHHGVIPRLGGLAIYAGFVVSILLTVGLSYEMIGVLTGATIIVIIGVLDDIVSLPAKVKLLGQIFAAAVLVCFFGVRVDWLVLPYVGLIYLPTIISVLLTIFWIIGFVNTVNLIDGLDGLAAGIAAIASITIAFVAFQMGQWTSAAAMIAMAGASIGFLQYNFNPARIFMGDTGSMFLGYVIGAVSVMGTMKTVASAVLLVPVIALTVPIMDTLMAIVRRKLSGIPIFAPDKSHLHHRLLAQGLDQKQVVLIMYAITAFFCCVALLVIHLSPVLGGAIILITVVLFLLWARKLGVFKENMATANPEEHHGFSHDEKDDK
jgi:UDP-GlcNAc:undecaprenyl-phosphate/decaprenyl-phosphate GlcNAc-1-phosphate transferase